MIVRAVARLCRWDVIAAQGIVAGDLISCQNCPLGQVRLEVNRAQLASAAILET